MEKSKDITIAVAAVKVLTERIEDTTATTVMELHKELSETACRLQQAKPSDISLKTACDLFLHYVARGRNVPDFEVLKKQFIDRGNAFAEMSLEARQAIARCGKPFIEHGKTILVHGYSRVVIAILKHAASEVAQRLVGRPNQTGIELAKILVASKISATVVLDSGVGYIMDRVDCVLVGAGGITQNGGVISKLGTYQIALAAKKLNKPFYVAAESYKFSRLYPLSQSDVPREAAPVDFSPLLPPGIEIVNPTRDFTPPEFISQLITDLGVLQPAAVNDELYKMYSNIRMN